MDVEALRHHQHQRVLGARHGDVEQPALLLDLLGAAGRHVGGDAAVDDVEDVDRLPLLPLGGVDGRQDQVVLVEQRHAGLRTRSPRRIEREVGQERFARGIARGDAHELVEIAGAHHGVRVAAARDGADTTAARGRARPASRPAGADRRCISQTRSRQASAALAGGRNVASASTGQRPAMAIEHLGGRGGAEAGEQLQRRGSR